VAIGDPAKAIDYSIKAGEVLIAPVEEAFYHAYAMRVLRLRMVAVSVSPVH
jgi:hypothetical protein